MVAHPRGTTSPRTKSAKQTVTLAGATLRPFLFQNFFQVTSHGLRHWHFPETRFHQPIPSQQYLKENKATLMKNQPIPTSATEPRREISQSSDEKFRITHWLGLYESHLFLNSPYSTYERYSRVLSRFYAHFPDKQFTYEFLRPDFEDYKQERLKEGASVTTVEYRTQRPSRFLAFHATHGCRGCDD